ncbi:MAG: PAS domain S-box protein [Candidatus Zapsychrus exili]|nr:PAS domain S-box protein [Candidatus Zapsychrus exili]
MKEKMALKNRDVAKLKKSEQEFEQIFKLSPDMLALCTPEGKFLKVNPSFEKVLGYKVGEILILGWAKLVHPDDKEGISKEVERQLKGHSVANFINRFRCKDGTYKILEWQATSSIDGIVYTTARNITERKQAEEKLQKFHTLVDQSNDSLYIIDPLHGEFLDVNKTACDLTGYARNELLQMKVTDLDAILPDNFSWKKHVKEVKRKGSVFLEGCHKRKDGTTYPVEVNVKHVSLQQEDYMVAIARDITERKVFEEDIRQCGKKFRLTMEATNDALWDWNIVNNQTYRNPRHATMLGYDPDEFSSVQIEWEKAIHPDDRDRVFKIIKEILNKEYVQFEIEYRLRTKTGGYIWVLGRGKVVEHAADGSPLRMIGTNIDITERKKKEEEIKNLAKFPSENPNPMLRIRKDGIVLYCNKSGLPVLDRWNSKVGEKIPERWYHLIEEAFKLKEEEEEEEEVNGKTFSFVIAPAAGKNYVNLYGRDITKRKKAENILSEQKLALEQKNIALQEMVEYMERTKTKNKENISINVEELLMPTLNKLKKQGASAKLIDLVEKNLNDLVSSFGRKITHLNTRLTPREIELCGMIKSNLSSKEISQVLNLSLGTIVKHRQNIRKKLNISNKKENLSSFLQNL